MELIKKKWNVQKLDKVLIARLIGELEGASYILDCIDESDTEVIRDLCKKYYTKYFNLK